MTIALPKEIYRMYVCVFCCEIQKLKLLSKITCHCVVTHVCCSQLSQMGPIAGFEDEEKGEEKT